MKEERTETLKELLERLVKTLNWDWRDEASREEALLDELIHVVPLMLQKMIDLEGRLPTLDCPVCSGTGAGPKSAYTPCEACRGTGRIRS